MLDYQKVLIQVRSANLDRTSDKEVDEFNDIVKKYRHLMFNEVAEIPRGSDGKKIDLDQAMAEKKESLFKPINVKLSRLTGEIGSINLKDLANGGPSTKV